MDNCLIDQHSEINRTHEVLQGDKEYEVIVVVDCHITSSAEYTDISLPNYTASEQTNFAPDASRDNISYVIFADQAIKPHFEYETIYGATIGLVKRLGMERQLTEGRTQESWIHRPHE